MRFEDDEIGGKEVGPTKIKLFGDVDAAKNLIGAGRAVLGRLKQYMQMSELTWHQIDVPLEDGSVIHAQSNTAGLADIDEIWIGVPPPGKVRKRLVNRCIGFIVHLSREASEEHFARVYVKGTADDANKYLTTAVDQGPFSFPEDAPTEPSKIENAFETGEADETGGIPFTYGEVESDRVETLTDGINPGPIIDPFWQPVISAGYYVGLNSWQYLETTVTSTVNGVEISYVQKAPHIYTGGYIGPPGQGARFKADPIPGTINCEGYANAVVANGNVNEAQGFIAGANLAVAAGALIAAYPAVFAAEYAAEKETFLQQEQFYDTDWPKVQKYAPAYAVRNKFYHVACTVMPKFTGVNRIDCRKSEDDAFIAVLPGKVDYLFDDPSWLFSYSTHDEATQRVTIGLSGGKYLSNLGFQCTETANEFLMTGGGVALVFSGQPDCIILLETDFTSENSYHGFTAHSEVPFGEYIVQGVGKAQITLLMERGIERFDYEFARDDEQYTKEIAIQIGQEFTGDFHQIIRVRDFGTPIWEL